MAYCRITLPVTILVHVVHGDGDADWAVRRAHAFLDQRLSEMTRLEEPGSLDGEAGDAVGYEPGEATLQLVGDRGADHRGGAPGRARRSRCPGARASAPPRVWRMPRFLSGVPLPRR